MLLERIRIQRRIHSALKNSKKNAQSIESAQKALSQLHRSLESLKKFNLAHPLLGRILRWIDRKFCIGPLNREIKRIQKLAGIVIPAKPAPQPPIVDLQPPTPPSIEIQSEIPAPKPLLIEPLEIDLSQIESYEVWEEYFHSSTSEQVRKRFISSALWYWKHDGQNSYKTDLFKRLMFHEEAFLKVTKFLKMNYNSQKSLKINQLDKNLIAIMPDLFACQLYRDGDLAELLLECMERNLSSHANHDSQESLINKLEDLVKQLQGQNDPTLTDLINKIKSIYKRNCIEAQLKFLPIMFEDEEPMLEQDFISIFDRFKLKHHAAIEQDPKLKKDLKTLPEEVSKVGIRFFIDLNHFIQGEKKDFIDQIGFAHLIYLNGSYEELWQIVQDLKNPDASEEMVDGALEWIIIYDLLKVAYIRNNPAVRNRFEKLFEKQLEIQSDLNERLRSLYQEFAIPAGFTFHAHLFTGTVEELRNSFEQINEAFKATHFELAFIPPTDAQLGESIRYLLVLNRFLKFKDEPLLTEEHDALIFDALPPILSHHIYLVEGVDDMLLNYFKRQMKNNATDEFLIKCLQELAEGMTDRPLLSEFKQLLEDAQTHIAI
jgi:hypothetical protein